MTFTVSKRAAGITACVLALLLGFGAFQKFDGYSLFRQATSISAPISAPGFRVLVVTDSENLAKMPSSQIAVITGTDVRDYLDKHCVKGPDGKTPEYRFFHATTDVSFSSPLWKEAFAAPRSSLPWILVSNGKTGYSGPLPVNTAETLKLLKKYGGE